jgi:hypothetical protein
MAGLIDAGILVRKAENVTEEAVEIGSNAGHSVIVSLGPPNTEISGEASSWPGFVRCISSFDGACRDHPT